MRATIRVFILGSGFWVLSSVCFAQDSSTTPPLGYNKIAIDGERDNPISIPLVQSPASMVKISSVVSTNSVRVSGAPWSNGQFAYVEGSQPQTYYAEFSSGALQGMAYKVVGNTADTLVLETLGASLTNHPKGTLNVGDLIRVRPFWTVGQVFGATDATLALDPVVTLPATNQVADADAVLFPNNIAVGTQKLPLHRLHYVAGSGWREAGSTATNQVDLTINPGTGLTVRRQNPGGVDLIVLGGAMSHASFVSVPGGGPTEMNESLISLTFPEPVALDDAGLISVNPTNSVIQASIDEDNRQDELLVFRQNRLGFERPPERTFIYILGQGWRELGSSSTTVGQDMMLEPGSAYLIRKQPGSGTGEWKQTPNY